MQSFNPMRDPNDDRPCKFDEFRELNKRSIEFLLNQTIDSGNVFTTSCEVDLGFTSPREQPAAEDDDEAIELMIRAFLDEKVLKWQNFSFTLLNNINLTVL